MIKRFLLTLALLGMAQTALAQAVVTPTSGARQYGSLYIRQVTTAINMAGSGVGTDTVTSATTALPAASLVLGVVCNVTTILAGETVATFSVGVAGATTRWGTGKAIAATTTTSIADFVANSTPYFQQAAEGIIVTANAGHWHTGILTCVTHYMSLLPVS
jgi:hypothetical protein